MKKIGLIAAVFSLLGLGVSAWPQVPPAPVQAVDADSALVKQYCAGCHSERGKAGGLSLASFEAAAAPQHADVAEKMIRKLRAGMMPPPGARRAFARVLGGAPRRPPTRASRAPRPPPPPGPAPLPSGSTAWSTP